MTVVIFSAVVDADAIFGVPREAFPGGGGPTFALPRGCPVSPLSSFPPRLPSCSRRSSFLSLPVLSCQTQGFIWPMLVGSAVMGPRTPEHLTELEAFFKDAPKPVGAGERCRVFLFPG